jgi:hypothetical protein
LIQFTPVQLALALTGSVAGIAYALLGLSALRHLANTTESEKAVGWSLWWFLEYRRYTPEGQRLCVRGGALFALGAACWLAAYMLSSA